MTDQTVLERLQAIVADLATIDPSDGGRGWAANLALSTLRL